VLSHAQQWWEAENTEIMALKDELQHQKEDSNRQMQLSLYVKGGS